MKNHGLIPMGRAVFRVTYCHMCDVGITWGGKVMPYLTSNGGLWFDSTVENDERRLFGSHGTIAGVMERRE